jgi:hypothetical protein
MRLLAGVETPAWLKSVTAANLLWLAGSAGIGGRNIRALNRGWRYFLREHRSFPDLGRMELCLVALRY